MIYMSVKCGFDHEDQPVEIYSEMDNGRNEPRKIHIFSDGRVEITSRFFETAHTGLSIEPLPLIEEIDADKQFEARPISKNDFEKIWR